MVMKVKFSNAEVEIYKLRKGTVVKYDYGFGHISDIGAVDLLEEGFVATIYVTSLGIEERCYSSDVEWLEV
jgi:hypothetical protein